MDKSEICPLNCTVVWICALRHFSYVSKWTVAFSHRALTGLVGRFYRCKIYLKTFHLLFLYCPALALKPYLLEIHRRHCRRHLSAAALVLSFPSAFLLLLVHG